MSNKRAFLDALKDIMLEHNVSSIGMDCAPCSDWHGIYDEEMVISFKDHPNVIMCEGIGFTLRDIENYLDKL